MNGFGNLEPLWLTAQLAALSTLLLLIVGTPVAYWLAFTRSALRPVIESLIALPLVLPPTVLGFYLLIAMGSQSTLGSTWHKLFGGPLAFSFEGLVIASAIYTLPFVVQPLQGSFESIGRKPLEAAATIGLSPLRRFFLVLMPLASRGFLSAVVLGFAHTLGEFGVVLMVGGNIPGETRVVSIAIYDHVETMEYGLAHQLSMILLLFSFIVLYALYFINRKKLSYRV